jgi:hypothetical protein
MDLNGHLQLRILQVLKDHYPDNILLFALLVVPFMVVNIILPACEFSLATRVVARSWIRSPSELMHSEVVKKSLL